MKLFKSNKPILVAIIGDTHINSTVGLPPKRSFPLDDGGMYIASKDQMWLLDAWHVYWDEIDKLVKRFNADLFIIFNGDVCDGDHHDTRQIITKNESTQIRMVTHLLDPVVQRAKEVFFVRGTKAHSGHQGAMEEKIAEDLGGHPALRTNGDIASWSWWELKLDIKGVRMDIKHHTTRSRVPRSKGHSANRLAADTQQIYTDNGWKLPHLVFRSHVHVSEDSHDNHWTRAIILPCFQLTTEYGHTLNAPPPTIGGWWVLCTGDEQYQTDKIIFPLKETQWLKFD